MNTLSTSYKDAVFSGSRKYTMTTNGDNSVSFTDTTSYTETGSQFGAADINATNGAVNRLAGMLPNASGVSITTGSWTTSGSAVYKDFTVTGILATDTPIISLYIPNGTAKASAKAMQKSYSYINNIETFNNKIRVWCHTTPTTAFTILIKGA